MKVASFFAGCGGLDLGFRRAGFDIVWANEFDESIHPTYRYNHPKTLLSTADIRTLSVDDIPDCDGFIGGPPCQAWSEGGKQLGLEDERGRLFLDYIRLIRSKRPKFFVIENVVGILSEKHRHTFHAFLQAFEEVGFTLHHTVLNAADFSVPQDRKRVFIVGFREELKCSFLFPQPLSDSQVTLSKAIGDITEKPNEYVDNPVQQEKERRANHDVYVGAFDAKYMARNRVRSWNEVSYTIQALAKNAPIHPQAPKMRFITPYQRIFAVGFEHLYRRLSVRECARIQTFPDSFRLLYSDVKDGYKMVGNAVPPRLAEAIAKAVMKSLRCIETQSESIQQIDESLVLVGYYKNERQKELTLQTKIYYVRAGERYGALKLSSSSQQPKYLLLHHKNEYSLYRLTGQMPRRISSSELTVLGFAPKGKTYWAFQLLDSKILPLARIIGGISFMKISPISPYLKNMHIK